MKRALSGTSSWPGAQPVGQSRQGLQVTVKTLFPHGDGLNLRKGCGEGPILDIRCTPVLVGPTWHPVSTTFRTLNCYRGHSSSRSLPSPNNYLKGQELSEAGLRGTGTKATRALAGDQPSAEDMAQALDPGMFFETLAGSLSG